MAWEIEDRRYLLEREAEMWRKEGDRAHDWLDDLNSDDTNKPGAAREREWYEHCFRKREQVADQIHHLEDDQSKG
jgi:hypothetical protein